MAYIEWIRNGPEPTVVPEPDSDITETVIIGPKDVSKAKGLQYVHEENILDVLAIQSLIDVRKTIDGKVHHINLHIFDMIVIGFLDLNRVIITEASAKWETIEGGHSSPYSEQAHNKVEGVTPTVVGNLNAKLTHDIPGNLITLLSDLGWTVNRAAQLYKAKCRAQKYYIINSAGPNGEGTWSAYSDAMAVLGNMVVAKSMNAFCQLSSLKRFMRGLIQCVQLKSVDTAPNSSLKLGKIITFAEWGGKTRQVASLDYWTQLILTPLHDTLFEILRSINEDATFDQKAAADTIKRWTLDPKATLYSFDLTAATDRLPVSLQARILNKLFNINGLGTHWANLLVLRDYYDESMKPRRYAVGAPMGSKSNWAMLALTHHLIVRYCATSVNINNFSAYRICGDDIVINNTKVAEKYREVMLYFGLQINESKSILHATGRTPAAEFCKRVFVGGQELTGFPVKLIAKTVMNGRLLPQLQNEITTRSVVIPSGSLYAWLGALADSQSHAFLALLNLIPTSISGLFTKIELPAKTPGLATWWQPHHEVTENDMAQAYTYVAAVEQLKRLDALLRQTVHVSDAIAGAMAANYKLNFDLFDWVADAANKAFLATLLEYQSELSVSHPIVAASQREAIRISLLLTKISNGTLTVETAARGQLLDIFRNALASMWDDQDAARAQADRTLIVRALDALESTFGGFDKNGEPINVIGKRVVSFSTKIAHLDKNWMVRWELGHNVTINTMRSKIVGSMHTAMDTAESSIGKLPLTRKTRESWNQKDK